MRKIVVVPSKATSRANPLLRAAGWEGMASPGAVDDSAQAAVELVRRGERALYVPRDTTPTDLHRILVVHEGTRGDRAAMDAADEAAVASGGEVLVLHVPPSTPSVSAASLPFRLADHAAYDYAEWRDEFLRRFCHCSEGVRVVLRLSVGSIEDVRQEIRAAEPDLVIVSGAGDAVRGRSEVVDALLEGVTPVLIVPAVGQHSIGRPRRAS
jgi:hypothetical protein